MCISFIYPSFYIHYIFLKLCFESQKIGPNVFCFCFKHWECRFENGQPEIYRCRSGRQAQLSSMMQNDRPCICPPNKPRSPSKQDRQNQRNVIRSYISRGTSKFCF